MSTAEQPDDNLLRRYLLGDRLADGERDRVERSYFESDRHFDRLLEAEDDLIDAYIRDRLSLAERARFERHFLAAKRRRDRYEAMRAIAANFFRERPPRRGSLLESFRSFFVIRTPAARTAAIALGAVSIVLLGSLGAGYVRLKRENTAARALLASSRPVPGRGVPTYTLRPGLLRSGAGDANHSESSRARSGSCCAWRRRLRETIRYSPRLWRLRPGRSCCAKTGSNPWVMRLSFQSRRAC